MLLIQVGQDEHVLKTQSQKAHDDMLRLTTRIMNGAVREMDLIGRYDHDCFGFLLPRTTLHEGLLVAQRVSQSTESSDPTVHCGPEQFTLKVGVAEVAEGDDVVRLLQRAEAAASAAEKNRICYHNGQWPEIVAMAAQPPALGLSVPEAAGLGDAVSST